MTTAMILKARSEASPADAIHPFNVGFSNEVLADLRRRILATRWPEKETVPDESQGVQLATVQKLARYWATDYDWRTCEVKLNTLPQFITDDRRTGHPLHRRPLEA